MNRVKPIDGERGRYFVASKSRKGTWHLVDTQTGECGCERFNENHTHHQTECHHIKAAKEYEENARTSKEKMLP